MAWRLRFRRWLVGVGAIALPSSAAFGWWVWVPRAIENEIVQTATRYGFDAEVQGAGAGWSSVEVDHIRLTDGEGVEVDVDGLSVLGSPFSLALEGHDAVEGVSVESMHARVDVAAGAVQLMRRFGAGDARSGVDEASRSGTARRRPALHVTRAVVELNDLDGRAVLIGGVQAEANELRLERGEIQLGAAENPWLALEGVQARVARAERWKLVSASVGRAKWSTDGHAEQELALLGKVATAREPREGAAASEGASEEPPWARFFDPAATFAVEALELRRQSGAFGRLAFRAARAESVVRLHGEGSVQDGEVRWSLEVSNDALAASGTIFIRDAPFDLIAPALPELPWWHPELGRLSADLAFEATSAAEVRLRGRVGVENLAVASERIAPHPVRGLSLAVEGESRWYPDERRLSIDDSSLRVGAAEVRLQGELQRREGLRVDVRATLSPTDCNGAVRSIPADLLQEAAGFRWSGRIGGTLRLALDSSVLDDTRLDLRVANGCRFEEVPVVADLRRFEGPFLHRVTEPDGSVFEMMAGPGSENWFPIAEISPYFVHAVLAHEDAGFFSHSGFAVYAIRDAVVRNMREGRYVQGASTISMQLTKNLLLHREKTIARKLQEVLLTWWIESALQKERILELYLNVIEYAPNVYGIVGGAEHYFGRSPAELTVAESAFLACVLPGPKIHHEHYERGSLDRSMRNRVRRFVQHLHERGRIDAVARDEALTDLETFAFHRPGQAVLPRPSAGRADALPFERSSRLEGEAAEEAWSDFGAEEGP